MVRTVVSTYQATSGAGAAALEELELRTRDVFQYFFSLVHVFLILCLYEVWAEMWSGVLWVLEGKHPLATLVVIFGIR